MEKVLEYIKGLPKDIIHRFVYELMIEGKINYHELMDMHIQNLERMRKGEIEAYFRLQACVMEMWCDYKKNLPKNLKKAVRLLMDEGRVNITEEKFEKYKAK
jgi:hypothetical protein